MIEAPQKNENMFLNLGCNIFAPILILNKLSSPLGPALALVLALAFPLGYGLWDLWQRKKTNYLSILGLVNTLITGGLALIGVTGIWFAVKEAAFPFLIGLLVYFSSRTDKPAVQLLFLNPAVFRIESVQERIRERGRTDEFMSLLRQATVWLAVSFFLSALLNFILARRVFLPIPDGLIDADRSIRLNEQIAEMHQWSFLVILAPSMVILMTIFFVLTKRIKALTGMNDEELFKLG